MICSSKNEYNCPVEVTLELIGGKWKSLILWHLSHKTLRFSELRKMVPKATQKMLTQQLRDLENHGLLSRKIYTEVPPKVEYSLTEIGISIYPILETMCKWGSDYLDNKFQNEASDEIISAIEPQSSLI